MNATLLPVLVKCCVLSKRQPRMCQPSHLALPNGLLNADIKLARSFALPFSSPSLSLSLHFALITSPSHPVPHPVTHLSSPSLSPSFCCSVYQPRAQSLPFFLLLSFCSVRLQLLTPEAFFAGPLYLRLFLWMFSTFLFVVPLFSNRLHNAFDSQDPSFSLTLLHVLSAPLHGLANAFVFGLDRDWWSVLSPTGMQVQQLHTHTSVASLRHANTMLMSL